MTDSDSGPLIFLVAGEPSGDVLGGRLMAALKARAPVAPRFAGIGGERMIADGLDSLFVMFLLIPVITGITCYANGSAEQRFTLPVSNVLLALVP
ncbi:MAG: hypothetical protein VCB77_09010, partial [Alphaproteobacteria bacterium]